MEHQMMNIPQKKYFCKRIDEIATKAIGELNICSNDAPTHKEIRIDAIKSGKVALLSEKAQLKAIVENFDKSSYWSDSWGSIQVTDILNPNQCRKLDLNFEKEVEDMRRGIAKEVSKIDAEATRIKDEAMLGSASQAQKLLAEFIKWVE